MNASKTFGMSLALAVTASVLVSTPSLARTVKQTKASHAYARSVDGVDHRGAYNDLARYGNRDGATVWLPGTTSPRVNSQ
jgi:hypothetical protein